MKAFIKQLMFKTLILTTLLFSNTLFAQDPNIILIIADDMGWSQVSTPLTNLNNPSDFYETPVLATLASEGIAFPHAYVNGANCAPTRAALLSGQYAARPTNNIFAVDHLNRASGITPILVGPANGLPSGIDELPVAAITLAETMKTAGYATVHLGKYHVGENEATNTTNNAATDQGFDVNYGGGTKGNPGNYFASSSSPYTFGSNIGPELDTYADPYTAGESLMLAGDGSLTGTPKHVTDAMADAAIDFMDDNNIAETPFFMHFSNFAVHGPLGESNSRPDLYAKYLAKNGTSPSSMGHTNIGIAAIAEGMDQSIGRLIDYLKTTPDPRNLGHMLSENTLVYFISDNGGAINTEENGPLRGKKGDLYEGGIRSVTFAWSHGLTGGLLANTGTVNTTPILAFDLYPTFVEAAGGTLPVSYDIDGASQWQMLTNGTAMTRESLYWHFPGYIRTQTPVTVIRKGDYKLIHFYETEDYELYDLINDISETTNLLSGSPSQVTIDLANDMIADMINHLTTTSAPLPTYKTGPNIGNTVPLPSIISLTAPNSTDGCQPTSGYEAFWDFDSVSNTDDASGNGHDAIAVTGTITYDSSDFAEGDQSIIFNGSSEIQYDSASFLKLATTARSVSVWIKPTALSGSQVIFEEGGTGNGLGLQLNGSNLEAAVTTTTETDVSISTAYPSDGNWHHVALIYNGTNTTLALYIDGVLASSSSSAPTTLNLHTSPGGIGGVIGGGDSFGNVSTASYFIGKMDAVAIYDTVLSIAQIEEAACVSIPDSTAGCQATSGYEAYWDFDIANNANDASGNLHNPNVSPTSAITYDATDFVEGDRSVIFDGTEAIQYATNNTSPDTFMNAATSSMTIATWIKPTALSGIQNIFDEGGQSKGIAIRLNGSSLESIVRESSSVATTLSTTYSSDGSWHHIALVYDGGNTSHKLFLDGIEVASNSSAASSIDTHYSYGGIGGKLSGGDSFKNTSDVYFTGRMDAFAIYTSVLNPTQIEVMACDYVLATENIDFDTVNDLTVVYPNPVENQINIKIIEEYSNAEIQIVNVLGQTVYSNTFKNLNVIEIPIQKLPIGQYFVKMTIDNVVFLKRVIKE